MTLGYETFGEGAHKVVVLHGWFGDQTFMHPMRDALSGGRYHARDEPASRSVTAPADACAVRTG